MLPERRSTPRRRSRDRIPQRETTNPVLSQRFELRNLLLFLDDDVRESAKSLARVEQYLGRALALLDDGAVTAAELDALSDEQAVFDDLHTLVDTLGSLRSRMGKVASTLRSR
ncbi:MAG TPA: hypothetical protein VHB97_04095 [Polyangia bacterium]|jgi:hypothetical protein|nr:hypothetical protein [Polyangia bacterium]